METMHLRTFQTQVSLQCQFMLLAAEDINKSLREQDVVRLFYALQNLLNAAANISKALWGQGGKLAQARKPLRDSIGIDDASPLREVTMRNNFEHLDERLDRWWRDSPKHRYVDLSVAPKGEMSGFDDMDMFRTFDPRTTDMSFWGQDFNIQALINEVQRIRPKLEAEANKSPFEA